MLLFCQSNTPHPQFQNNVFTQCVCHLLLHRWRTQQAHPRTFLWRAQWPAGASCPAGRISSEKTVGCRRLDWVRSVGFYNPRAWYLYKIEDWTVVLPLTNDDQHLHRWPLYLIVFYLGLSLELNLTCMAVFSARLHVAIGNAVLCSC